MGEDERKLFVGRLPMDIREEEISHIFSTYGPVAEVHILPSKAEDTPKSCFVTYGDSQGARAAVQVLDNVYKFREGAPEPIRVSIARPKRDSKGGDKGGGRGYDSFDRGQSFGGGKAAAQEPVGYNDRGPPPSKGGYDDRRGGGDRGGGGYGGGGGGYDRPGPGYDRGGGGYDQRGGPGGYDQGGGYGGDRGGDRGGPGYDRGGYGGGGGYDRPRDDFGGKGGGKGFDKGGGYDKGGGGGKGYDKGPAAYDRGGKGYDKGGYGGDRGGGGGGGYDRGGNPGYDRPREPRRDEGFGGGYGGGKGEDRGGHGGGKGFGGGGKGGGPPGCKLYIGNLPADIQKDSLEHVFGTYGKLEDVHVMSGRSKSGQCAAFINYSNQREAEACMAAMQTGYEIRPGEGNLVVKWPDNRPKGEGKGGDKGGDRFRPY